MSATPPSQKPPARWSRLLIASLAINLLVAGLIGGAAISRHRLGGPPDFAGGRLIGDPGLRGFLRTLPSERRAALRTATEQSRSALRPLRQTAQRARLEMQTALNAVPIDPVRVERAMGDVISAEGLARRAAVQTLVAALSVMTPQERAQFQSFRRKHERSPPDPLPDDLDKSDRPGAAGSGTAPR
jgi:uncharacterized membrane protein